MKRKLLIALCLIVLGSFIKAQKSSILVQKPETSNQNSPTIQIQTGHNTRLEKLKYSKCGNYIVSYASSITIIWDVKSGRMIKQFADSNFQTITPDNLILFFNSITDEFEFWGFDSFTMKSSFKRNSKVEIQKSCISSDGKYLAAGGKNYFLVYELPSGNLIQTVDIRIKSTISSTTDDYDKISSISFNTDNTELALSTYFGNVFFFSVKDWASKNVIDRSYKDDYQFETFHTYSPDGKYIVLYYPWKNYIQLLSTKDYSSIGKVTISSDRGASYAAFTKDSKTLMVGVNIGPLLSFDTNSWSSWSFPFVKNKIKESYLIDFSPAKDFFVSAEGWDLNIYTSDQTLVDTYKGNIKRFNKIDFNQEKQVFLTSSTTDIQLWDMRELKLLYTLKGFSEGELSPKGNFLGAYDCSIGTGKWVTRGTLIDLSKKSQITSFTFPDFGRNLAFSNDERYFVYGGMDKSINIYDIQTNTTSTVYFPEFQNSSSTSIFATNPITNELLLFGGFIEMAYYNFSNHQIRYLNDYLPRKSSGLAYNVKFSQANETFAFHHDNGYSIFMKDSLKIKNVVSSRVYNKGFGFSADGKKMAIPTNPFVVVNVPSGKTLKEFPLKHTHAVTGLVFTNNDKNIISCSEDGSIKLWNYNTGEEIYTFLPAGTTDDFIFLTPDGYYKTTQLGSSSVHYVIGNKVISFEQFDLKYNRPDIVLQRAGGDPALVSAYHSAYLKRLRRMGFTEKDIQAEFNLPELAILTTNIPLKTDSKQLSIKVKASDKLYDIDRINLYVNDIPIFGQKGISIKSQHLKEIEKELSFELSAGLNKVQVSAMNSAGVESYRENFEITYTGAVAKPSLYLVSIGVSDFLEKDYNLTYAAKDAQDLETLVKTCTAQYSEINTILLTNENATVKNILDAKLTLQKSKPDDVVMIFVASHGLLDSNLDYYIATHDCSFSNPAINGLAYDKLESLLDSIPARNKLMLIDACHSGEVDKDESMVVTDNTKPGSEGNGVVSRGFKTISTAKPEKAIGLKNSFELMNEIFMDIRKGTGAIVISSAGGMEFAFESAEWKNGVFTYTLLEGLKKLYADANKDRRVSVSELKKFVIKKVQTLTNGKQNPTSRIDNRENDFIIWQ